MNNAFSKAAIWVVIALVLFTVFRQFDTRQGRSGDVPYSQFMKEAESGRIESVQIDGRTIRARTRDGQAVTVFTPGAGDIWMVGDLVKYGVQGPGQAGRRADGSSRRSSSPGSRCCC